MATPFFHVIAGEFSIGKARFKCTLESTRILYGTIKHMLRHR